MEPPAKRMRILQSVEVDEENPDYISARQKQQQKFKGRLESIFAKYGNMHESMSDEIDMTTNSVVVDRGHLRRLKRQVGRKEAMLLDTLGLTAGRGPEEEEAEDGEEPEEDSEDELAPTEPVKSDSARHGQDEEQARTSEDDAHPLPSDDAPAVTPHVATPIAPISHFNPLQAPNTPNPTAGLLPVVQFPQTPAGQQAQTTFYTTLTQGLGELVYKAMAQSGLLPLNCPTPFANVAPPPTTPLTTADKIAPATDPKWFFPPLSEEAQQHVTAQSSPPPVHPALPATGRTGRRLGTTLQHGHRGQAATVSSPLVKETPLVALHAPFAESSPIRPRRTSPRVEIQRRRIGPPTKYPFSKADDIYISRKKVVDGLSLTAIKESQAKWKDWPLGAFRRRWTLIKDQNLHIHKPSVALSEDKASGSGHEPDEQARTSPMQSHHLPTPSSSEHEDSRKEADAPMGEPSELPSSAHYDDDELELLSLAGADVEEDQQAFLDEERTPDAVPEDAVIPSIETPDMINEDQLQRDLLENLPMRSATLTPTQPTPVHIKTEPVPSSPLSTRKPIPLITSFETIPDSEDNLGDDIEGSVRTSYSLHCPVCKRPFKTAKTLARHQANPRGTHTHMATVAATAHSAPRRRSASSSIDLINDQDTQDKNNNDDDDDDDDNDVLVLPPTTTTPQIKRELSTPPANFFSNAFQTPKAKPDLHLQGSSQESTAQSTSKVDKRVYMKQIKRGWMGATPAPATVVKSVAAISGGGKRKSLGSLGDKQARKRLWGQVDGGREGQGDDEWDELCM